MALPEFVVPVLSTAGLFSLLCVIVRNFSQVLARSDGDTGYHRRYLRPRREASAVRP